MKGLSFEEKELICKSIERFYFYCNRTAFDNALNEPSLRNWLSFTYACIPWFIYVFPLVSWSISIFYFYFHRERLNGFPTFVMRRNFFVAQQFYRVTNHCFWNPCSFVSNVKLIWFTCSIVIKDDLEMYNRVFNVKMPGIQRCNQLGCDVMTANHVCIQCRIDKGKKARLKRIYTLLMLRKKEGNVWHSIPNDVFKLFVHKYFE